MSCAAPHRRHTRVSAARARVMGRAAGVCAPVYFHFSPVNFCDDGKPIILFIASKMTVSRSSAWSASSSVSRSKCMSTPVHRGPLEASQWMGRRGRSGERLILCGAGGENADGTGCRSAGQRGRAWLGLRRRFKAPRPSGRWLNARVMQGGVDPAPDSLQGRRVGETRFLFWCPRVKNWSGGDK